MARKYINESIWEIAGNGGRFNPAYPESACELLNALVDYAGSGSEENTQIARYMAQILVKHLEKQAA